MKSHAIYKAKIDVEQWPKHNKQILVVDNVIVSNPLFCRLMNTESQMYDHKTKRALFTIPAYNEEKNIGTTIANIRKYYRTVPICVINDCSNDNTKKFF